MSGKSRQMNKGAMKVHLAYQAKRRAETAAAVADREASGRAPSCPACHGKHRAHTCAQRSSRTPAARGTAAATASRNGTAAPPGPGPAGMMHIIPDQEALNEYFDEDARQQHERAFKAAAAAAAAQSAPAPTAAAPMIVDATRAAWGILSTPVRAMCSKAWRSLTSSGLVLETDEDASAAAAPAAAAAPSARGSSNASNAADKDMMTEMMPDIDTEISTNLPTSPPNVSPLSLLRRAARRDSLGARRDSLGAPRRVKSLIRVFRSPPLSCSRCPPSSWLASTR